MLMASSCERHLTMLKIIPSAPASQTMSPRYLAYRRSTAWQEGWRAGLANEPPFVPECYASDKLRKRVWFAGWQAGRVDASHSLLPRVSSFGRLNT